MKRLNIYTIWLSMLLLGVAFFLISSWFWFYQRGGFPLTPLFNLPTAQNRKTGKLYGNPQNHKYVTT
jgi:hypothetical protein